MLRLVHKLYKLFVSPLLGNNCKYYPYCSDYSVEAIEKHGFIKGILYGTRRVLKCGPYSKGGFDPVPEVQKK